MTFATFFQHGMTFIIAIAMARLLTPEDFGIVAMAMVFVGINEIFIDFGTRDALIRQKSIERDFLSSIFWFNVAIGFILFLMMLLFAEYIANLYELPIISLIVIVMSVNIIFSSTSIVPKAILMRNMDFRAISVQRVLSVIASAVSGIPLAFHGYGVWSLVAQQIAIVVTNTVVVWLYADWFPRIYFKMSHIKQIFSFSAYLSVTKFTNYFTKKGDLFLIGKFLDVTSLGFYSKGYGIFLKPLKLINGIIQPVLFPAICKIQLDNLKMRNIYLKTSLVMALIYFPILSGSFFFAKPLVIVLLGNKWAPVAQLVPIFSAMSVFISQSAICSQCLRAKGRTRRLFYLMLLSSIVTLALFIIGLQWGIVGVAIGYCISIIFQYFLFTAFTIPLIEMPVKSIVLNFKAPFLGFVIMLLIGYITVTLISGIEHFSNLLTLIVGGGVGFIFYLAIVWFYLPDEILMLLAEFFNKGKFQTEAN